MAANASINSIAGALTISGAVNGATRTLTLLGAGNLTLSGIITLTTGGIICSGIGTIILSAANAYTGATSVNSGAVRISNASALGTAGAITVAPSGQLEISGAITFARAIAISGIGSTAEGSLLNRSGNNTFSGAITLNADSTIGSSVGIFTISGTITGATRNLILTTAAGAEIVSSGQIALTTGTLQKTGAGTLTISGTTSNYTGSASVLQGILRITSLLSFGTSSEVIVGSGATLQIQPAVAGTFSKLTTISGDGVSNQGALNNTALSNTIGSGVLRVGSSTSNRIASASTLTLTINGITRNESLLAGAAAPLTFGGAGIITLTGVISTTGTSGLSSLTKVDAGTLNLGNLAHVYNGSTTISAGTLTRSVVSGAITATGSFTAGTTLNVTFTGGIPAIGSTWKFFPADTTNTYTTVALTGATGRTGSYNKTTSTLTIS
jgi:autotransporter-associated beta strand protein